jgi:hypothetical protein
MLLLLLLLLFLLLLLLLLLFLLLALLFLLLVLLGSLLLLLRRALLILLSLVAHLVDYLLMKVLGVLQRLVRLRAPFYLREHVVRNGSDRLRVPVPGLELLWRGLRRFRYPLILIVPELRRMLVSVGRLVRVELLGVAVDRRERVPHVLGRLQARHVRDQGVRVFGRSLLGLGRDGPVRLVCELAPELRECVLRIYSKLVYALLGILHGPVGDESGARDSRLVGAVRP